MALVFGIGGLCFLIMGIVGCGENDVPSNMEIVIEGSTVVLGKPACSFNPHGEAKEIAVLRKGDKAPVLGIDYTKDCMVYKIKLADGRVGYVTFGDKFREIGDFKSLVMIVIDDSTNLMSKPDTAGALGNEVVAVLKEGDVCKIIQYNDWEGVRYFKVQLFDDGHTGYLRHGENYRVLED